MKLTSRIGGNLHASAAFRREIADTRKSCNNCLAGVNFSLKVDLATIYFGSFRVASQLFCTPSLGRQVTAPRDGLSVFLWGDGAGPALRRREAAETRRGRDLSLWNQRSRSFVFPSSNKKIEGITPCYVHLSSLNLQRFLGSSAVWRPVATRPANARFMVAQQGQAQQPSLTPTLSPVLPSAQPVTLFTARKTQASAEPDLTGRRATRDRLSVHTYPNPNAVTWSDPRRGVLHFQRFQTKGTPCSRKS